MALAVFNSAAFLTSPQLAVAAGATIEVRRESDSGLASIYSDLAGTAAITNPSPFADSSGRFTFYTEPSPGGFSIQVTRGAVSYTLRDVFVGVHAADVLTVQSGIGGVATTVEGQLQKFTFRSDWTTEAQFNTAVDVLTGATMGVPESMHFAVPAASGDYQSTLLKFRNPDTVHGPFTLVTQSSVSNGDRNTVWMWGYNVAANGTSEVPGAAQVRYTIESDYNNAVINQSEAHFSYVPPGEASGYRVWTWSLDHASPFAVIHLLQIDNYQINDKTGVYTAVQILPTTTSATVTLSSNTQLRHKANNQGWLYQRNAADTNNVELARADASDRPHFGPASDNCVIGTTSGSATFNGHIKTVTNKQFQPVDGSSTLPAYSFAANTNVGFYSRGGTALTFVLAGTPSFDIQAGLLQMRSTQSIGWASTDTAIGGVGTRIYQDAAGIVGLRNGANGQTFKVYADATNIANQYRRMSVTVAKTTLSSVTGASVTATNLIPAGAFLVGITTRVTAALGTGSGTSGYTVGDGSDADRWGAVTGTAIGTDTDNSNATANATGFFTAAQSVVITAAGGNFDGTGDIAVDAFYMTTEAD